MIHARLAAALAADNQTEEAISHYRQALRIDPDLVSARQGLARLFEAARASASPE